jgi:hypothetical protein
MPAKNFWPSLSANSKIKNCNPYFIVIMRCFPFIVSTDRSRSLVCSSGADHLKILKFQLIYPTKAIYIYQAMTLTKDSVLWNGLPQSDNIASPTFSEKNRNPLNLSLYLHLSNMSDLILRQFKNA